jgi:hypothetical protein
MKARAGRMLGVQLQGTSFVPSREIRIIHSGMHVDIRDKSEPADDIS